MLEYIWIALEFILKAWDAWETLQPWWKVGSVGAALIMAWMGQIRAHQRSKLVRAATRITYAFVTFAILAAIGLTLQYFDILQGIPDRPSLVPTKQPRLLTLDDREHTLSLTAQNLGVAIKTFESRVLVLPHSLSRPPLYRQRMHSDPLVGFKGVTTHDVYVSELRGNTFHLRTQPLYIIWDMRYVDAETDVLFNADFYLKFTSRKSHDGQYETTLEEAEIGEKVAIRRYVEKFGIQPFEFDLDMKLIGSGTLLAK